MRKIILLAMLCLLLITACQRKPEQISEVADNAVKDVVDIVADETEENAVNEDSFEDYIDDSAESPIEQLAKGFVSGFEFQIGDNINDVVNKWGQPTVEPFYWAGGEWHNYGDYTFIVWIDDPIIRHIGFDNDVRVYGIKAGDSIEKIKDIMEVEPDIYSLDTDSDNDIEDELAIEKDDKQVLSYVSGEYSISFYCDETKLIHGYIFYRGN